MGGNLYASKPVKELGRLEPMKSRVWEEHSVDS